MAKLSRYPVVAVVGMPGALLPPVSACIHRLGWLLTWPGQNTAVQHSQQFVHTLSQNYEVRRLHEQLCNLHGINQLSHHFPRWYLPARVGPEDYVAKFSAPFVLSDVFLPLFLDWWGPHVDIVVDVQATEEDVLSTMTSSAFSPKNWSRELVVRSMEAWQTRYAENLRMFPRVYTLTNSEVRGSQLAGLSDYLRAEITRYKGV